MVIIVLILKNIAKLLVQKIIEGGVIVWVTNDATIEGSETCTSFNKQCISSLRD